MEVSIHHVQNIIKQTQQFFYKEKAMPKTDVQFLTRRDTPIHLLSFFADLILMLIPTLFFICAAMLTFGAFVGRWLMEFTLDAMPWFYVISICGADLIFLYRFQDQTFGMRCFGFKIADENGNSITSKQIVYLRQVIGVSMPLIILFYLFSFWGIIFYMILNSTMLIDVKSRIWIDYLLHTTLIKTNQKQAWWNR